MSVMTLREIPDDLQEFLRADAAANHRSMNKQVIVALDEYRARRLAEQPRKLTVEEKLARTREIQADIKRELIHDPRTDDEILGYDEFGLPT
jgi:plasmid stability protein